MPTPSSAATGMPTPRPTPNAVVLDFFAGSAAGADVEVADAPALDAEEPAEDAEFEPLFDADADADAAADADANALVVATEEEVEEAAEVWV